MPTQELQYPVSYLQPGRPDRVLSFRNQYQLASTMNPWESCALQYHFDNETEQGPQGRQANAAADPVMYPGLYCPSGIDVMNILLHIASRPNPKVELGAVDCSVALVICDLEQPDAPIVYASEHFCMLTGYSNKEIIGRNCRFLQAPPVGVVRKESTGKKVDKATVASLRKAVETNDEIQVKLTNFKKDGTAFVNLLTMIPIRWKSENYRYSVGFQVERDG
ncbi:hypothetical protein EsH8_II_001431 [Colletotrichum jinshuiense]